MEGGLAGTDTLEGGAGNDTYLFKPGWGITDVVTELANGGKDKLDFSAVPDTTAMEILVKSGRQRDGGSYTLFTAGAAVTGVRNIEALIGGKGINTYKVSLDWGKDLVLENPSKQAVLDLSDIPAVRTDPNNPTARPDQAADIDIPDGCQSSRGGQPGGGERGERRGDPGHGLEFAHDL